MVREGLLPISPIAGNVAAISVGYVDGELMLDLDYSEDSAADVDMNIVMDHEFNLVEVQGTGEQASFSRRQLEEMIDLAAQGIGELFEIQNRY
jgi:ribonuclease PH